MKHVKEKLASLLRRCPFFCLLVGSGICVALLGLVGEKGIYAPYVGSLWQRPLASVVFLAAKDGVYPWALPAATSLPAGQVGTVAGNWDEDTDQAAANEGADGEAALANGRADGDLAAANGGADSDPNVTSGGMDGDLSAADGNTNGMGVSREGAVSGNNPDQDKQGDALYGNASDNSLYVVGAGGQLDRVDEDVWHKEQDESRETDPEELSYVIQPVTEEYFDDALFIGDSRMVGLRDYAHIEDRATFYAKTSLTVWDIFAEPEAFIPDSETGHDITVQEALEKNQFGKIYLMVGINELGRGTVDSFSEEFENVVNHLLELQPDAIIIIQAIMHVGAEKNGTDPIFNNANIDARNDRIALLADNRRVFYVDGNPEVCDENGNLREDYTFDQVHLYGIYYAKWKDFLLTQGIVPQAETASENSTPA